MFANWQKAAVGAVLTLSLFTVVYRQAFLDNNRRGLYLTAQVTSTSSSFTSSVPSSLPPSSSSAYSSSSIPNDPPLCRTLEPPPPACNCTGGDCCQESDTVHSDFVFLPEPPPDTSSCNSGLALSGSLSGYPGHCKITQTTADPPLNSQVTYTAECAPWTNLNPTFLADYLQMIMPLEPLTQLGYTPGSFQLGGVLQGQTSVCGLKTNPNQVHCDVYGFNGNENDPFIWPAGGTGSISMRFTRTGTPAYPSSCSEPMTVSLQAYDLQFQMVTGLQTNLCCTSNQQPTGDVTGPAWLRQPTGSGQLLLNGRTEGGRDYPVLSWGDSYLVQDMAIRYDGAALNTWTDEELVFDVSHEDYDSWVTITGPKVSLGQLQSGETGLYDMTITAPTDAPVGVHRFTVLAGVRSAQAGGGTPVTLYVAKVDVEVTVACRYGVGKFCGLDVVVVLDRSGSISQAERKQMEAAVLAFIDSLMGSTPAHFGVVNFGTTADSGLPLTDNVNAVRTAATSYGGIGGMTNWQAGLSVAESILQGAGNREGVGDLIIFASDGAPTACNTPGCNPFGVANIVANRLKDNGVAIIGLGIGVSHKQNMLTISSPGGYIETNFTQIAADMADIVRETCGGSVTVQKYLDGNPAEGWTFEVSGPGGFNLPMTAQTASGGQAIFEILTAEGDSVSVDITETLEPGKTPDPSQSIICVNSEDTIVRQSPLGASQITGVPLNETDYLTCTFYNTACGNGAIDPGETCDPAMSGAEACRDTDPARCTYCGDGTQNQWLDEAATAAAQPYSGTMPLVSAPAAPLGLSTATFGSTLHVVTTPLGLPPQRYPVQVGGALGSPVNFSTPAAFDHATADLTGDGRQDAVFLSPTQVSVLPANLFGGFGTTQTTTLNLGSAASMKLVHLTSDATRDLIVSESGSYRVYLSAGNGLFTHKPQSLNLKGESVFAASGSTLASQPGIMFAATGSRLQVYLIDKTGLLAAIGAPLTMGSSTSVITDIDVGKANADAWPDAVVTVRDGLQSKIVTLTSNFPNNPPYITADIFPASDTGRARFVDVDNDGVKDIVHFSNQSDTPMLGFHRGNGNGTFLSTTCSIALPRSADAVTSADINADGRPDLIFSHTRPGAGLFVLLNSGQGLACVQQFLGEKCDDGNSNDADGCRNTCVLPVCGDGISQSVIGDQCDDGNSVNTDTCTNTCKVPVCGDTFVQPSNNELCDDGDTDATDSCVLCRPAVCGDGHVRTEGANPEQCDDSNTTSGDGCSATCQTEACGNNVVDSGETCDDGPARAAGDGCDANCQTEICGNQIVQSGEQCDDNNAVTTDNCISCQNAVCGDTFVWAGQEQCDDGNSSNADSCIACVVATCGDGMRRTEGANPEGCDNGVANSNSTADACRLDCSPAACGDGVTDSGEQCDSAGQNADAPDACRLNCRLPDCGDGIQDADETCDDGNTDNSDGCDALCVAEVCGNGIVQGWLGEECDEGGANANTGTCTTQCKAAVCGDTLIQTSNNETCDDGNTDNGDGCDEFCIIEICGDGTVNGAEECDDSNTTNGDGCSSECLDEGCGDGVTQPDEQCDTGATQNLPDQCRIDCRNPACGDGIIDTAAGEVCDDANRVNADACTNDCRPPVCGDGVLNGSEQCDDNNVANNDTCTAQCQSCLVANPPAGCPVTPPDRNECLELMPYGQYAADAVGATLDLPTLAFNGLQTVIRGANVALPILQPGQDYSLQGELTLTNDMPFTVVEEIGFTVEPASYQQWVEVQLANILGPSSSHAGGLRAGDSLDIQNLTAKLPAGAPYGTHRFSVVFRALRADGGPVNEPLVTLDLELTHACSYGVGKFCGLDVVLVLDRSGSISYPDARKMEAAAMTFADRLIPETPANFGVVHFGQWGFISSMLTNDLEAVRQAVTVYDPAKVGGVTNWEGGLRKAVEVLAGPENRPAAADMIIFASDGGANWCDGPCSVGPFEDAMAIADGLKPDTPIISLGIGMDYPWMTYARDNMIKIGSPGGYIDTDFDQMVADLVAIVDETCGGSVTVRKLIDGQAAEDWDFTVSATGPEFPQTKTTDLNGFTIFEVLKDEGTSIDLTLTESATSPYAIDPDSPIECRDDQGNVVATAPAGSTSIDVTLDEDRYLLCTFNNTACGNGAVDPSLGETCDPNAANSASCRDEDPAQCTFCGDGERQTWLDEAAFSASLPFTNGGTLTSAPGKPVALAVGRFNADATPDVLAVSYTNAVSFMQNQAGALTANPLASVGSGADLAMFDADADGDQDVLLLNKALQAYPGNGNGTVGAAQSITLTQKAAERIHPVLITADADPDLIVYASGSYTVYTAGAGLGFTAAGATPRGYGPIAGMIDAAGPSNAAVLIASGSSVEVWRANVAGQMNRFDKVVLPGGSTVTDIVIGDVSGDGSEDAVVLYRIGPQASVAVLINEMASFTAPGSSFHVVTQSLAQRSTRAALLDVDDDGALDIAHTDHVAGKPALALLQNDGSGVFTASPCTTPLAHAADRLYAADMNGDGRDDLVGSHVLIGAGVFMLSNTDHAFDCAVNQIGEECDDGNSDNGDTCNNACESRCYRDADCAGADDAGNACTIPRCDLNTNTCELETVVCDDGDACTINSVCDPAVGAASCTFTADPNPPAMCQCTDDASCGVPDTCMQYECLPDAVSGGRSCVESVGGQCACNGDGVCSATEDCTCSDCFGEGICSCTSQIAVDMVFVIDTSGSFADEWQQMRLKLGTLLRSLKEEGYNARSTVVALTSAARCPNPVSSCDYETKYVLDMTGAWSVVDVFADGETCTQCSYAPGPFYTPAAGRSQQSTEAWGPGGLWVLDNNEVQWRADATKFMFVIGDQMPTGGGYIIEPHEEYYADELGRRTAEEKIHLFGLHGGWEYNSLNGYGDSAKHDFQELMERAVAPTNGSVIDYGANTSALIGNVEQILTEVLFSCGLGDPLLDGVGTCRLGSQTCDPVSGELSACMNAVGPGAELCDSLDNDCDGTVDNGNVCIACVNNGICDANENCTCGDCRGEQDGCSAGQACSLDVTAGLSDHGSDHTGGQCVTCNLNDVCDANENCDCSDCTGESTQACPGVCGANGSCEGCDGDLTCEAGETCLCSDCFGQQSSCPANQICDPAGGGSCQEPPACVIDEDCADDGNICTAEACIEGLCQFIPNTCNDGDACTTGTCSPTTGECSFVPVASQQCECVEDDDCNVPTDTCRTSVCIKEADGNHCEETFSGACACNSNGVCDTGEDCTCGDCSNVSGCTCTNQITIDIAFAIDTSGSFIDEWALMRQRLSETIAHFISLGYNIDSTVYALVDPAFCNESRCVGASRNALTMSNAWGIIDVYADAATCTLCTPAIVPMQEIGKSKTPAEAWGVGGAWILENHTWRTGAQRVMFIMGDQVPAGGWGIDGTYDVTLAENLRDAAIADNVTLFGLHGQWESRTKNLFGDPAKLDLEEMMKLAVEQVPSGQVVSYEGGTQSPLETITDLLSQVPFSCGLDDPTMHNRGICHFGTQTCSPDNGQLTSCVGFQGPETEICDGLDNDCDGTTDEGGVCACGRSDSPGCDIGECCGVGGNACTSPGTSDHATVCQPCDETTHCGDGLVCDQATGLCTACGNGVLENGEQCDQGSSVNGTPASTCTALCQQRTCVSNGDCPIPFVCSDGICTSQCGTPGLPGCSAGECCTVGGTCSPASAPTSDNASVCQTCDTDLHCSDGFVCNPQTNRCSACGNGTIESGEQCDPNHSDPAIANNCSQSCQFESCTVPSDCNNGYVCFNDICVPSCGLAESPGCLTGQCCGAGGSCVPQDPEDPEYISSAPSDHSAVCGECQESTDCRDGLVCDPSTGLCSSCGNGQLEAGEVCDPNHSDPDIAGNCTIQCTRQACTTTDECTGTYVCHTNICVPPCGLAESPGCQTGQCCNAEGTCTAATGAVSDHASDHTAVCVPCDNNLHCGNGLVCDPTTNGCTACGNGTTDTASGEVCDDGVNNGLPASNCTAQCTHKTCDETSDCAGGFVCHEDICVPPCGSELSPGCGGGSCCNATNNTCTTNAELCGACTQPGDCATGFDCDPVTGMCTTCGNATIEAGEQCDQGRTVNGTVTSNCTNTCQIKTCTTQNDCPATYVCSTGICVSQCGEPSLPGCNVGECCSDSNVCTTNTGSCGTCDTNADCRDGLVCDPAGNTCTACGNGAIDAGEICDPAHTDPNIAGNCTAQCTREACDTTADCSGTYVCHEDLCVPACGTAQSPGCGGGECCTDANVCTTNAASCGECTVATDCRDGLVCDPAGNTCTACGNGAIDAGEICDPAHTDPNIAGNCTAQCTREACDTTADCSGTYVCNNDLCVPPCGATGSPGCSTGECCSNTLTCTTTESLCTGTCSCENGLSCDTAGRCQCTQQSDCATGEQCFGGTCEACNDNDICEAGETCSCGDCVGERDSCSQLQACSIPLTPEDTTASICVSCDLDNVCEPGSGETCACGDCLGNAGCMECIGNADCADMDSTCSVGVCLDGLCEAATRDTAPALCCDVATDCSGKVTFENACEEVTCDNNLCVVVDRNDPEPQCSAECTVVNGLDPSCGDSTNGCLKGYCENLLCTQRPSGLCQCTTNTDCPNGACNTTTGQCVECTTDTHCTGGEVCSNNQCVQCNVNADCLEFAPSNTCQEAVCNANHSCVVQAKANPPASCACSNNSDCDNLDSANGCTIGFCDAGTCRTADNNNPPNPALCSEGPECTQSSECRHLDSLDRCLVGICRQERCVRSDNPSAPLSCEGCATDGDCSSLSTGDGCYVGRCNSSSVCEKVRPNNAPAQCTAGCTSDTQCNHLTNQCDLGVCQAGACRAVDKPGAPASCTPECVFDSQCASLNSSDQCKVGICVGGTCQQHVPSDSSSACGAYCGNGAKEAGEQCDKGSANGTVEAGCDRFCQLNACGSCPGGYRCIGDQCVQCAVDTDCRDGHACREGVCVNTCGNGLVDTRENCDDGNQRSGDGCSQYCQRESVFLAVCGDTMISVGEQCDDGGILSGDGCSAGCLLEAAFTARCGDGTLASGEQCDDRNVLGGDGCSTFCQLEFGATTSCGDGILTYGEQCDDGNVLGSDGCSNFCRLESSLVAAGTACGNGLIDPGEECDDANRRDIDGCSRTCFLEQGDCGDGVVQRALGEQCEDAVHPADSPYECNNVCRFVLQLCGNGVLNAGEQCDDGSLNSDLPNALCRSDCRRSACGDGIMDTGEQCDDGNAVLGDGCDRTCASEVGQPVIGFDQVIPFSQSGTAADIHGSNPLAPLANLLPFQGQSGGPVVRDPSGAPQGDTGPVAVAVMAAGAAAGLAWTRRRRRP